MPSPEIFATLDIRTLILVTALIYLMCTLTQGFIYLNNRDEPGLGKFVIAHALINLGLILIAARGLIPDLLSMVIANASILSGLTFLHHAIRCFYQRPTSLRATAVVFVLSCLAFFHFGQSSPDYAIRVLLFSLPFIVLCILIAREFFIEQTYFLKNFFAVSTESNGINIAFCVARTEMRIPHTKGRRHCCCNGC